jgi:hypothetical protein
VTSRPDIEQVFPTTTPIPIRGSIAPGAAGTSTARRSRSRFLRLTCWPRHRRLTLAITYRAGSEGWYLVQARGESGVFAGSMAIEDVMSRVYAER